jgi:predicted transcriptional regulator
VNKTLLIIICDFLLISVLALVEFKPTVETTAADEQGLRDQAAEEMLELLQLSLEHESSQRLEVESSLDETREQLTKTSEDLQEKSQTLAEVNTVLKEREQESEALSTELDKTRGSLELTLEEKAALAKSLEEKDARSRQLQQELQAQQALAEEKNAALAAARTQLENLETEQRQLSTQLQIRETEKQMLEQNLITARAEVDRARIEAERAQQQSESLAVGVSELAASSSALKEEFRQAQPLSMNTIFKQFEDNRIFLRFQWEERAFLGSTTRQAALQTILVQTSQGIHALFATGGTPFAGSNRAVAAEAVLTIGSRSFAIRELGFLESDKGIAAVRVPDSIAQDSGLSVFPLSSDPFRFSQAVLVSDDQELYGEIPIRVPPGEDGYLEVESKLFNRLFGEFSPNTGDFVFSMTGELIGIMVGNNRARLLKNPQISSYRDLKKPE